MLRSGVMGDLPSVTDYAQTTTTSGYDCRGSGLLEQPFPPLKPDSAWETPFAPSGASQPIPDGRPTFPPSGPWSGGRPEG
jgi:hypothetical protein